MASCWQTFLQNKQNYAQGEQGLRWSKQGLTWGLFRHEWVDTFKYSIKNDEKFTTYLQFLREVLMSLIH